MIDNINLRLARLPRAQYSLNINQVTVIRWQTYCWRIRELFVEPYAGTLIRIMFNSIAGRRVRIPGNTWPLPRAGGRYQSTVWMRIGFVFRRHTESPNTLYIFKCIYILEIEVDMQFRVFIFAPITTIEKSYVRHRYRGNRDKDNHPKFTIFFFHGKIRDSPRI